MNFKLLLIPIAAITAQQTHAQIQLDSTRVIFPKETPVHIYGKFSDSSTRFTPIAEDINLADSVLNNYLYALTCDSNQLMHFEHYHKQYTGFEQNGKKIMYVNAAYKLPEYFYLQDMGIPAKGGGSWYFKSYVDLTNKSILDFHFNAPK